VFSMTGESGVVYHVEDAPFSPPGGPARLHRCRDHNGRELVAKMYVAVITDPRITGTIRAAARQRADDAIGFPLDVLADGPSVIGVVLPLIPQPFLQEDGRPRTFDSLCSAAANPPDAGFRVATLLRVCEMLAVLESAGVFHGDISQRNLLWRADRPDAHLPDCDGVPSDGPAGAHGYADPRGIGPDAYSDRFGLAVLMYRGLLLNPDAPAPGAGGMQRGLPGDLDPRLRGLFDRAFGDPYAVDARPTATQWRDTLREVFFDGFSYRQGALEVLERHAQQFRDEAAAAIPAGAAMQGPPPHWQGMGQPPMPGPYPGPPRPASSSTPLIIAAIAVPLVLIVLVAGGILILHKNGHSSRPTALGATYTDPITPYSAPTTSAPEPDPTTSTPLTDPTTTYEPPRLYYRAIAVARSGRYGRSWDYSSRAGADKKAMSACKSSTCKVLTDFVNGCGAVAYNPKTNMYWGGHGDTKTAAQRNAISNAGGGHWIVYQCTTRP
jgi:hypothetical protein